MKSGKDFQKVQGFLVDLLLLHGLSKSYAQLLFELIPYFNQQNQITINSFLKKELESKLNTSKGTINNAITKLTEANLLQRIDRGVYTFHPLLFKMLHLLDGKEVELKITYVGNKKKINILESKN